MWHSLRKYFVTRLVRSKKLAPLVHSRLANRIAWLRTLDFELLRSWYHVIVVSCLFSCHLKCLRNVFHIPLAGQGLRHGDPEADKLSQHHFKNIMRMASWDEQAASLACRTIELQSNYTTKNSAKASVQSGPEKTIQWQTMQQRSAGPYKLSRNVQHDWSEPPAPTHFFPTCGRGFLARIGPIRHLWTHRSISSTN